MGFISMTPAKWAWGPGAPGIQQPIMSFCFLFLYVFGGCCPAKMFCCFTCSVWCFHVVLFFDLHHSVTGRPGTTQMIFLLFCSQSACLQQTLWGFHPCTATSHCFGTLINESCNRMSLICDCSEPWRAACTAALLL